MTSLHRRGFAVFVLAIVMMLFKASSACTVFNATQGTKTLAGNNEDFDSKSKHHFWIIPASTGKNGRVYVLEDLSTAPNYIVGGMNQHGLFFDWTALGSRSIPYDPNKLTPDWGVVQQIILEKCATVEEALAMYTIYNEHSFEDAQVMWADSTGASAVVGFDYVHDSIAVTRKHGRYQIITNFNLACETPDGRYNSVKSALDNNPDISVKLFTQMCDLVQNGTLYSVVYNLETKDVYITNTYASGGFRTSSLRFNLLKQISLGEQFYNFDSLTYYPTVAFLPPIVTAYAPSNNAVSVSADGNLTLLFDKRVYARSGTISILTDAGSAFEQIPVPSSMVSGSGTSAITINPANTLENSTRYHVLVPQSCFTDTFGNACEGISASDQWRFTTAGTGVIDRGTTTTCGAMTISNFEFKTSGILVLSRVNGCGTYTLSLYDFQGRNLSRRQARIDRAGEYTWKFNFSEINVAHGEILLAVLQSDTQRVIRKLTIQGL
jgi:hypothetical protein